ncbi:hypothetical protein GU926_11065 [Nibribacter ruber]|uniref:Uncharacterized protein n=1 Tax=Nibribacter ruber TaxID=2698458 RepID=A0A6P1P1W5_9BACT|nr:hypothetical protein [Nibribacter ruber]QHL87942.1 hypothetical protein GU926_11065 [Nibribacter ruber]
MAGESVVLGDVLVFLALFLLSDATLPVELVLLVVGLALAVLSLRVVRALLGTLADFLFGEALAFLAGAG